MQKIHYDLSHILSQASVALFAPRPRTEPDTKELMTMLGQRPLDSFLHAFAVGRLLEIPREELIALHGHFADDQVVMSLLLIVVLLRPDRGNILETIPVEIRQELVRRSPLNYGRVLLQDDYEKHHELIQSFRSNIDEHTSLDSLHIQTVPDNLALESETTLVWTPVARIRQEMGEIPSEPLPPRMQVFQDAMHKLYSIGAIFGQEMRHQASLSPWAIQRNWTLDVGTSSGTNQFRLSGPQTSYGRGLDLEGARVSCAMEVVERFSSYANIRDGMINGCVRKYPLIKAGFEELREQDKNPLDPGTLCLEAPYAGESLYWMEGHTHDKGDGHIPAMVPVQCAFLFSNLDEPDLFSGLSSTGLASGTLMDQAKTNAIVEVIERDSKGTHLFDPSRCFRITTDDPELKLLLKRYANLEIEVQFQDITGELGIPCYRCYVIGPEGQIITGTAANLDGNKALIAAMTETPYPFPNGPRSQRDPRDLPVKKVEALPAFSTGSPAGDRVLLETLLERNGLRAYYADLTCRRLGFPVVRAIIPGLEIMTDFDAFSRVSPRLYARYLHLNAAKQL
jgi:ribosomal protein S12 methylthiotransferase accessory factor YcaO